MPEKDSDLEKILEEYLRDEAKNKRAGLTILNLFLEMEQYRKDMREMVRKQETVEDEIVELTQRVDAHRGAIIGIKRVMKKTSNESEEFAEELDTGSFDVVAIEREVRDLKAKRMHSERVKSEELSKWKWTGIKAAIAVAGFVAMTAIGILLGMALGHSPAPQTHEGK